MDADKVNEAAMEYRNSSNVSTENFCLTDIEDAFEAGTQWRMKQPLANRLTDEEKEKIMAIYKREVDSMELETHRIKTAENEIAKVCHESNFWQAKLKADMLEQIFGKSLFNQPTEV